MTPRHSSVPLLILALFAFSPLLITQASVVLATEDRVLTMIRSGVARSSERKVWF